jgi:type III restriction enzyme
MAEISYKNSDFVLTVDDDAPETLSVLNKYETFLAAHCAGDYAFQRDAVRAVLRFLVSSKYKNIGELAAANYRKNDKLQRKFQRQSEYLDKFALKDKKACSLDLATGTGKSYVMYALAQIALAEGLVEKVLVLCPSLTIEEGLKDKFEQFAGDNSLKMIIREGGTVCRNPSIKNANEPILNGDICVENIHAAYERTGSSIEDSFKGKGGRTLVINDEAHHIFSPSDTGTRKWFEFLNNPDYGFHYIVNLSGTPYTGDAYFHDVVFRFSIRDAIDKGVVKRVDYKIEQAVKEGRGFHDSYEYHRKNRETYGAFLRPISIVVTEKIVACITVWKELVTFIAAKEEISEETARKKVIWVTSGVPAESSKEGKEVRKILGQGSPEKLRKENILRLKTVDDPANPVEWIVSVSMLTEGWDVKNVFQVVPHENKAFNSKLLIAQVLGRGLRMPPCLAGKGIDVLLRVNNHERWTGEIENLYRDVLEIENRLSWGYDPARSQYAFPLHNLSYEPLQTTAKTTKKAAGDPKSFGLSPQNKVLANVDTFSETGEHHFDIFTLGNVDLHAAATTIHAYLKQKDPAIARRWSRKTIRDAISDELSAKGYDATFLSRENYLKVQQAFGPSMSSPNEESPRFSLISTMPFEIEMETLPIQTFHEGGLKNEGMLFYDDESATWFAGDQKALFDDITERSEHFDKVAEELKKYGVDPTEHQYLKTNIRKIGSETFKTPLSVVYVSHAPERDFAVLLFSFSELMDSFIKNSDKGFYSFPYSFKPETKARTHVRRENFNPDFFLKKGDDIIVVEIKKDGDDSKKNAAKLRDGMKHFDALNAALAERGSGLRYYFKFLSPALLILYSYDKLPSTLLAN